MVDTVDKHDIASPSVREVDRAKRSIARDEGHDLIASDRVEGTEVFRPDGEKIGKIHHFMVGKLSGQVEYAVLSFGGFLGMGKELRPVPWDALDYDTDMGGYIVSAKEDTLRNSPYIERGREPAWDRAYGTEVFAYWGLTY